MLDKDSLVSKHIGNYYTVAKIRGSSPISTMYKAEHIDHKHTLAALKIFHTIHLSQQQPDLFFQEVQRHKRLKHTHLLPLLDAGIDDDVPYLVTEYIEGNTLRDRLRSRPGHLLPVQEAVAILTHIGQALYYAHQRNVVHGRLKPENILLREGREVLLTDFSLVTLTDTISTEDAYPANIYPYMAPEQFAGWMNKSSDQYALGCIAYELFTGRPPFSGSDFTAMQKKQTREKPSAPTQQNLLLPIVLEEVVLKAMEKNSADRYPTIQDFIVALQPSVPVHAAKSLSTEIARTAKLPAKPIQIKPSVPTISTINLPKGAKYKGVKTKMVRIDSEPQVDKLSPALAPPMAQTTNLPEDAELKQVQPNGNLQADMPPPALPLPAMSTTRQPENAEPAQKHVDEDTQVDEPSRALIAPAADTKDLQEGIEPKLESMNDKAQVENPSPATPAWSYSNDELPTQKELAIAPSTVTTAESVPPPLSGYVNPGPAPSHRPALQQSRQTLKRSWLVLGSSFLIVIVIISGLLYAVLEGSFSPKTSTQVAVSKNVQLTSTPTSMPSLTLSPTPTPKQAQVPIQAVHITPTLTITSSTPSPSPSASPSPTPAPATGLSVTPTSLPTGSACQRNGKSYMCTITLQLSQNHSGNLNWSAYSNGISASIIPSRGTLSPGNQQSVYSYITTRCPSTGTLIFTTGDGNVSVPWSC